MGNRKGRFYKIKRKMMAQKETIQKLNRKVGSLLVKMGVLRIQVAFQIKPTIVDGSKFRNELRNTTDISTISIMDRKYYMTDWETWKEIIELDWTDQKKYIKEQYDCDDFAFSFKARASEVFGLNSVMACYGKIYNKDTGALIGSHYWNIILTDDNKAYYYEPITDKYAEASNNVVIGNWRYSPVHLR